jgi:hypothetical protein
MGKKNPQALLGDSDYSKFAIYSFEIAPLGHTSAQVPHSVHNSGSML